MKLYHGTNVIVWEPKIMSVGYKKDFGYGFYCTRIQKQAERWAISKRMPHIVCVYDYKPNDDLCKKTFPEMSDEWLDFVVDCRHGITHQYDIVEGPMADDQIWDYVEDFIQGIISREAFWVLARFKHPTHQIVFCSDKALQTLTYQAHYEL